MFLKPEPPAGYLGQPGEPAEVKVPARISRNLRERRKLIRRAPWRKRWGAVARTLSPLECAFSLKTESKKKSRLGSAQDEFSVSPTPGFKILDEERSNMTSRMANQII